MATKLDTTEIDKLIRGARDLQRNRYIIHDGVEYGVYVELGTERMPARPALIPAFEKWTKELPDMLKQSLSNGDIVQADRTMRLVCTNIVRDWSSNVPVKSRAYKASITFTVER